MVLDNAEKPVGLTHVSAFCLWEIFSYNTIERYPKNVWKHLDKRIKKLNTRVDDLDKLLRGDIKMKKKYVMKWLFFKESCGRYFQRNHKYRGGNYYDVRKPIGNKNEKLLLEYLTKEERLQLDYETWGMFVFKEKN